MKYTITSVYTMSLRKDHTTYADRIGTMMPGQRASGDEVYECTEDGDQYMKGDKWLSVLEVDGKPVTGWMAIVHMGRTYCTIADEVENKFVLFLHEYEITGKSKQEWAGFDAIPYDELDRPPSFIPSVFRAATPLTKRDYTPFKCNWQNYSYWLIVGWIYRQSRTWTKAQRRERAKVIFRWMYRGDAFQTNKRGSDTKRDCVNKSNMDKELMGIQSVYCRGNVGMVVAESNNAYGIRCFNAQNLPPHPSEINHRTHPWLVGLTTIETRRITLDGGREIRPFSHGSKSDKPHLAANLYGFPYFVLLENSDIAWVPKYLCRVITREQAMANNPIRR